MLAYIFCRLCRCWNGAWHVNKRRDTFDISERRDTPKGIRILEPYDAFARTFFLHPSYATLRQKLQAGHHHGLCRGGRVQKGRSLIRLHGCGVFVEKFLKMYTTLAGCVSHGLRSSKTSQICCVSVWHVWVWCPKVSFESHALLVSSTRFGGEFTEKCWKKL